MEQDKNVNKIIGDALCLLSIMAELHEPLKFFHYSLPKGLCIVVEDSNNTDGLLCAFDRMEDFEILQSPRISNLDLRNYKLAVYTLQKKDSPEILSDFLTTPKSLTALLIPGFMPDYLPETYKIVIPAISISDYVVTRLNEEICAIKNFFRNDFDNLEEEFEKIPTSADYMNRPVSSALYTQMLIAAKMYQLWYRSCHIESDTQIRYLSLLKTAKDIAEFSENFQENVDLSDIVVKLFFEYTDNHHELYFSLPDQVSAEAYRFMKDGDVIFFDSGFYYVSEKLFKKICSPLLKSFGWLYIKEKLRQSDILYCNDCQHKNYTSKKLLVTEHGIESRNRFLWLRKDFFISWDRLLPEERRDAHGQDISGQTGTNLLLDSK